MPKCFIKNIITVKNGQSLHSTLTGFYCRYLQCTISYAKLNVFRTNRTFISSFTRFIARRGCPVVVLSDNGSNLIAEETQQYAASKIVEWKFNLESAPWYGRFWERLVGTVKRCLKKNIGKSKLSYDELQTVFLEIENVLNSIPLCYLYDDDQEDIVTPNHLLYGRKLNVNSINSDGGGNFNISMENVTKRMRYMNSVIHFWRRWSSEYCVNIHVFTEIRVRWYQSSMM